MDTKGPEEEPKWAKELNAKIEMAIAIINNYQDDNQRLITSHFSQLVNAQALMSSTCSAGIDGMEFELQGLQLDVASQGKTTQTVLGQIREDNEQIISTQSKIRSDLTDIEARLSDMRNRLSAIESDCSTIIELVKGRSSQ
jgi:conjugal transfer/entry exclusion protein